MGVLGQVGNLDKKHNFQRIELKNKDLIELLSTGKKGYSARLNRALESGKLSDTFIFFLKINSLSEKIIVDNLEYFEKLNKLFIYKRITKSDLECFIKLSFVGKEFKINKLDGYVKQLFNNNVNIKSSLKFK